MSLKIQTQASPNHDARATKLSLYDNQLSGAALPPLRDAIAAGALPALEVLQLYGTPALDGYGREPAVLRLRAACEERGACWPLNSSESHRRPLSAAGQRGLVFCPPVKVRNIHW